MMLRSTVLTVKRSLWSLLLPFCSHSYYRQVDLCNVLLPNVCVNVCIITFLFSYSQNHSNF